MSIVAVSHCWLTQEQPDPKGEQMARLCAVLRLLLESTHLEDVALFMDWCSLHQKPRTPSQEQSFTRALGSVHLWYAHSATRVWMLNRPPEGAVPERPSEDRGWPFLEQVLGEMLTKASFLLDLSTADWEEREDWESLSLACRPRRRPPPTPEAFEAAVKTRTFVEEADRDVVVRLYSLAFFEIVIAAEELLFNDLNWGDEEAVQLAKFLPRCRRLRKLALYGNRINEEGAMAIAEVLQSCPTLEELWLSGNPVTKVREAKVKLGYAWAEVGHTPEMLHL